MSNTNLINKFVRDNVSEDILRHLLKIDSPLVFGDCYRVNVWTQKTAEDKIVPTSLIEASFLLEVVDGEIVDRTITEIHQVR